MSDSFPGQVAIITGAARGIGKNIARALGLRGAHVVLLDIDREAGRATEAELRRQSIAADFLRVDLSRRGAPQDAVRRVARQWGGLDILINNARSGRRTHLWTENEETWDEGLSVTLRAAFFASQEAIRFMARRRTGSIVNLGSVAATLVCHESPVYHVAKAGVVQMTRYLAVHAGRYGIRVNCVLPGFIVQDEHEARYAKADNRRYRDIAEFSHPVGHVGKSDDVAAAVCYLSSPQARFISGQCLFVDGGSTLQEQSSLMVLFSRRQKWSTGI